VMDWGWGRGCWGVCYSGEREERLVAALQVGGGSALGAYMYV